MKDRCLNPRSRAYKNYGARGITIDERWLGKNGIANFLEDLGPRAPGRTLNRIDNDGGYCKENCEWATKKEQQRNTRRTKLTKEIAAEICREHYSVPISHLARVYGVSGKVIQAVLSYDSWQ